MEKRDPESLKQLAQDHMNAEGRAGAQRGHPVLGGAPPSLWGRGGTVETPWHRGVRVTVRRPGLKSHPAAY